MKNESLDRSFVEFVVEQLQSAGTISHRYMFGGCAIYCEGKVVALICDDQLYVRPTQKGREFAKNIKEEPPYPGAKLYFLIGDKVDDRDWLCRLIKITADELPEPKAKKIGSGKIC